MEPVLDAEIAGHFRHPAAHGLLVAAQALQAEGQLVPDLVGDDLVIGVLHNKADFPRLVPVRHLFERNAVKEHLSPTSPAGRQHGFQVPQKGTLAAAGGTAEHQKFSLGNGQVDMLQRVLPLGGSVRKGQILDLEMCHCRASFMCNTVGIKR